MPKAVRAKKPSTPARALMFETTPRRGNCFVAIVKRHGAWRTDTMYIGLGTLLIIIVILWLVFR